MSMGGREAVPEEGGRRIGEVGCGPVCQTLAPSLLRPPAHPLSLFLGCLRRWYSY